MMEFENRVLRKIFKCRRDKGTGNEDNTSVTSFLICTPHISFLGCLNEEEWYRQKT
jgi:hypothetical protein